MVISLDPTDYPHIFEEILSYCDWETVLTARLVCRFMRQLADRSLIGDTLYIDSRPKSIHPSSTLRVQNSQFGPFLPLLLLPCFHPDGSMEAQRYAMSHATLIVVVCRRISQRLFTLLHYVSATCEVVFEPKEGWMWNGGWDGYLDFHFDVPSQCPCRCAFFEGLMIPKATGFFLSWYRLGLDLPYNATQSSTPSIASLRCSMVSVTINPLVGQLQITGDVCSFPEYFADGKPKTRPWLETFIVLERNDLSPTRMERLCGEVAESLGIPQQQVQWELNPWKALDRIPERE